MLGRHIVELLGQVYDYKKLQENDYKKKLYKFQELMLSYAPNPHQHVVWCHSLILAILVQI